MTKFDDFGLSNAILKSTSALGYEEPTPIQRDAIPVALDGQDIMGLAQTGTGKTAAFGLPLAHHLLKDDQRPKPKTIGALIVAPTRELVKQIGENLREFTRRTPLRVNMVVGGASIHIQKRKLEKGTDILVATPGRLMDLVERKALYLDSARYLVLDEADQMLDLGFIHVLRKIAKMVGKPRQTMLFSATMPKQIEELANAFLTDPVRIEVSRSGKAADKVTQCVHFVGQGDKATLLRKCLSERENDLSLVFSRTKHGAEKLMKRLVSWGFSAGSVHGNKSQGQRERAIRDFKNGDIRILVATDVAARGIDIRGVSHVYNFDLPDVPENYVHRIGRTARAGCEGEAIAFCSETEVHLLAAIEKLMAMDIDIASGERPAGKAPKKRGRGGNSQRRPQGRSGNRRHEGKRSDGQKSDGQRSDGQRNDRKGRKQRGASFADEFVSSAMGHEKSGGPEKSGEDRGASSKNKRPGRCSRNEGKSSNHNPNKVNGRFKTRGGKKRGKKKPVAA